MKYVKGLDTLRALAVFFVIVEHWGPFFGDHTTKQYLKIALLEDGQFGVNLFFVLSGFLITSILLNEKLKNTNHRHLPIIKNFFIRRVLRIFPIYYIFIFACLLLQYDTVPRDIGYYLTYTSNLLPYRSNMVNVLSHTWSLSVEEQFYIIWPWIIIFVNWKYIKHILVTAVFLGIISKFLVMFVWHHTYPVLVINCFDSFGIGGIYAYMRLNRDRCRKFDRSFIIIFPFMLFMAWRMSSFGGSALGIIYALTLNSIIALALIMFVLNNKSEWMRRYILENRVLNFVGRISYGVYLYHYTLGRVFDNMVLKYTATHTSLPSIVSNFYFLYCVKLILLIILCWMSFVLIEQPILKLKKRFEYSPSDNALIR